MFYIISFSSEKSLKSWISYINLDILANMNLNKGRMTFTWEVNWTFKVYLDFNWKQLLRKKAQEKTSESHHNGNAWVFPSISHSMGKCNKIHHMKRTWEIGTHTFPKVWLLFSRRIPILWYTSSHRKCMSFPINFP